MESMNLKNEVRRFYPNSLYSKKKHFFKSKVKFVSSSVIIYAVSIFMGQFVNSKMLLTSDNLYILAIFFSGTAILRPAKSRSSYHSGLT